MIIGIDASRAVKEQRTRTENYSYELIKELVKVDRTTKFRLYAPSKPNSELAQGSNVDWQIIPAQKFWSQMALVRQLRHDRPDLLFVPSHVVPYFCPVPSVATIHGLEYLLEPESYSPKQRRYLNFATKTALKKARALIAPSHSTKNDLVKYYKANPAKIFVTPEAYDKQIFNDQNNDSSRPIAEPYFFFIGRLEKRKNVTLLIEAFELLSKEKTTAKLVLAGKPGYGYEQIEAKLNRLPTAVRHNILLPGYVSDQEAARYLQHATAFMFPSLYEGFGIPILEAMAMGTPVICSNRSSLPEVAGESAVLLPPTNPLAWASAMSRILHQPNFAKQLREQGIEQAQQFSWAKTAQQTLEILLNASR